MRVYVSSIQEVDGKFPKKVLITDKGEKININKTNKCYDYVVAEGPYEIEWGEYKGNKFVKTLKFHGAYPKTETAQKPQQGAVLSDRTALDKAKQDDIKLEFYSNIAKDVLIYNKKQNITVKDIMSMAKDFVVAHEDILELKAAKLLPAYGLDYDKTLKEAFPDAEVVGVKQKEEEPFNPDDIPF